MRAKRPAKRLRVEQLEERLLLSSVVAEVEPNDQPIQATVIALDAADNKAVLSGSISGPQDLDHGRFQVAAGSEVILTLTGELADKGGRVTLLDLSGREVASGAVQPTIPLRFRALQGGEFVVRVSRCESGCGAATSRVSPSGATSFGGTSNASAVGQTNPSPSGSNPAANGAGNAGTSSTSSYIDEEFLRAEAAERAKLPQVTTIENWTQFASTGERINFAPSIVRLAEGGYRIYWNDYSQDGITSAVSNDGITFTAESGVRLSAGGEGTLDCVVSHPWVIAVDGGYRMYYQGDAACVEGDVPGKEHEFRIFSAFSTDGLTFTREGVRIDIGETTGLSQAAHGRAIRLGDGTFRMYFSANFASKTGPSSILGATSADGLTWSLDSTVTVEGGHDPTVIQLGDKIFMYTSYQGHNLLKLESTDGVTFTPQAWVEFYNSAGIRYDGLGDIDMIRTDDGRVLIYGTGRGTTIVISEKTGQTSTTDEPPASDAVAYELEIRSERINPVQGSDEQEPNNTASQATPVVLRAPSASSGSTSTALAGNQGGANNTLSPTTSSTNRRGAEVRGIAGGATRDRDYFRFTVQAGEQITVRLHVSNPHTVAAGPTVAHTSPLDVAVFDSAGRMVARSRFGTDGTRQVRFRAARTGDYYAAVVPIDRQNSANPVEYRLGFTAERLSATRSITAFANAIATDVILGSTRPGALARRTDLSQLSDATQPGKVKLDRGI